MMPATGQPIGRGIRLLAALCLLARVSACGSQVEGEERGAAFADLSELADEVTLDALECAHEPGFEEAYLTANGGNVGGVGDEANVSDCFAVVLEQPEYEVFSVIINVEGGRSVAIPITNLTSWVMTVATIQFPAGTITPIAEQYDCVAEWGLNGGCGASLPA